MHCGGNIKSWDVKRFFLLWQVHDCFMYVQCIVYMYSILYILYIMYVVYMYNILYICIGIFYICNVCNMMFFSSSIMEIDDILGELHDALLSQYVQ